MGLQVTVMMNWANDGNMTTTSKKNVEKDIFRRNNSKLQ